MSGSGIIWAICKSAPRSRQITMQALHHAVFYFQMPFLLPNQQRQNTEGRQKKNYWNSKKSYQLLLSRFQWWMRKVEATSLVGNLGVSNFFSLYFCDTMIEQKVSGHLRQPMPIVPLRPSFLMSGRRKLREGRLAQVYWKNGHENESGYMLIVSISSENDWYVCYVLVITKLF